MRCSKLSCQKTFELKVLLYKIVGLPFRKVNIRLPGKRQLNSHGARPVHLIITMIEWIRTSRLSTKNSLSGLTALLGPYGRRERESALMITYWSESTQ